MALDIERETTILLVEDDSAIAESVTEGLEREGYSIHWESLGAAGIAYAREKHPRLVVLDVRLPDISGFDVCREMRRLGLRQPILMLTVQGEELDKVLGLEMGADDYMTKPYKLRELVARIRALLRRAYGELSTAEADLLYVADLVIDRTSAQVTRGAAKIDLTPIEFRLLVFLAQHPGQVFSRGQLLEQVWGSSEAYYDETTVNVHVRRLRAKIELEPSDPRLDPDRTRTWLSLERVGMSALSSMRTRIARVSLRRKLPAAFAGVALLTMVVLGAILVPLVSQHYSRSEVSYLKAAAQQAATGLSTVDWPAVAAAQRDAGGSSSSEGVHALRRAQLVALSTQVRVRVYDPAGTLLVDSGSLDQIDVVDLTERTSPMRISPKRISPASAPCGTRGATEREGVCTVFRARSGTGSSAGRTEGGRVRTAQSKPR